MVEIPYLVIREENFVEVKAHEDSLVEEHDSREKEEEKKKRKVRREHNNNGRS